MSAEEGNLAEWERRAWRDGDWPAAILSFSSRQAFLPLLRMRDASGARSRKVRVAVSAVFYPAYAIGMVVWGILAVVLLMASPLLFFVSRPGRR
jgi:hypothetical protein